AVSAANYLSQATYGITTKVLPDTSPITSKALVETPEFILNRSCHFSKLLGKAMLPLQLLASSLHLFPKLFAEIVLLQVLGKRLDVTIDFTQASLFIRQFADGFLKRSKLLFSLLH